MNKKQIYDPNWDNRNKMVAHNMLSNQPGTMNLGGKLVENAGILAMFHMNLFGNTHNLVMGVDFTPMLDNPQRGKDLEDWNKYLNFIIEKEAECEYILQMMEKSGNAKLIESPDQYEEDIHAHTETLGRWHFHAKAKKSKILA